MANAPKSFQQVLQELWELLRDYARQETLGPLKNLGWQLKWGVPGAFLVALGVFLLAIGILRGLEHVEFFEAHNYRSYGAVVFFLVFALALIWKNMRANLSGRPKEARR